MSFSVIEKNCDSEASHVPFISLTISINRKQRMCLATDLLEIPEKWGCEQKACSRSM